MLSNINVLSAKQSLNEPVMRRLLKKLLQSLQKETPVDEDVEKDNKDWYVCLLAQCFYVSDKILLSIS